MNAPIQCALPTWLEGREAIHRQIRERVRPTWPNWTGNWPSSGGAETGSGGRLVCNATHSGLESDEQTVLALLDQGVWVHPGYFFGMAGSGWLVVSLLGPEREFSTGVTILIAYLETHQGSNSTGHGLQALL